MNDVSDWELVARSRAGDMNAFAVLVRRYQTPVMQFCYRMVGSAQDAEEVAQESFVRVYRHLHRLEPQAKFSTLLFGIARNLALNMVRDAKRRGRGQAEPLDAFDHDAGAAARPDREARLHELEALIERGMELLSEEHREILLLREVTGMDYDGIAKAIRCRKGTVKSRLARAREALRVQVMRLSGDEL